MARELTKEQIERRKYMKRLHYIKNRDKYLQWSKEGHLRNKEKNKEKTKSRHRVWYIENKEKITTRIRKYELDNKKKRRIQKHIYYNKNKDKIINQVLKKKYNIDLDIYSKLLEKQQYKCAICKTGIDSLKKSLSVDHDHDTGSVRGLLCSSCNLMLGNANDNITILDNAIIYLKKNDTNTEDY